MSLPPSAFHLAAKNQTRIRQARRAVFARDIVGSTQGWGPLNLGGRWGSARIQPVLVGRLVIEISDTRKGAIVWRSMASSDIGTTDKPAALKIVIERGGC